MEFNEDSLWFKIVLYGMVAAMFVGIITLGILAAKSTPNCTYTYHWRDALGREGTASNCYQNRGNLICVSDGGRHQVIEYNHICQ